MGKFKYRKIDLRLSLGEASLLKDGVQSSQSITFQLN